MRNLLRHPFVEDFKTIIEMARSRAEGNSHGERLENFYTRQAAHYDAFRARLLHGRQDLIRSLTIPDDAIWVDLGGGTAANLEFFGGDVSRLRKVYVVDLAPSLLAIAKRRIGEKGWSNVETVCIDANKFQPPEGPADIVTFSYSLSMMPNWKTAIDHAHAILKPRGRLGVVDFFVNSDSDETSNHGWWARTFWPAWFRIDGVELSPDRLEYLQKKFTTVQLDTDSSTVPYLSFLGRVPYFRFEGSK